ncbi:hypothetical protein QVD17_28258 [Tagetes erecta]|uniref:Tobamovirus multiplication protein 2A n=1 Tax=Tagetes erecta TaxID=13708 RepID=A0AAD8NKB3_TARER|nr:hypothetical protein QVD17_28258 [Tagetes erecta]
MLSHDQDSSLPRANLITSLSIISGLAYRSMGFYPPQRISQEKKISPDITAYSILYSIPASENGELMSPFAHSWPIFPYRAYILNGDRRFGGLKWLIRSKHCWLSKFRINKASMACKGCLECLLKLLNFLLTLVGLAMVGYGVYMFVMYNNAKDDFEPPNGETIQLGRPILMAVSLSTSSIFDNLPTAWFIYLFVGIGAAIFIISCFGCIGAATRSGCCLTCYSLLLILLILVELGCAAFIFFDKSWKSEIPLDETGKFDMIYGFLEKNWEICRWVALGAVILEALIFLLALMVRAANSPAEYDSDDEYIAGPRQQRQPLISRQPVAATPVPVTGTLDTRPSRNDAWSTRMREKYGLDTTEFTYNPNESNRYQQGNAQPTEEKIRCSIM